MQTVKTDETGQMPRMIRVFAGCTGHFVGFCHFSHAFILLYYGVYYKFIGRNRLDAPQNLIFPQTSFIYSIMQEYSYG